MYPLNPVPGLTHLDPVAFRLRLYAGPNTLLDQLQATMQSLRTRPEECPHIIVVQFWAAHLHTKQPTCSTTFERYHVPAWQELAAYARRFRPGFFVWLGPGREGNFSFEWQGLWEARALVIRATLARSGHPPY